MRSRWFGYWVAALTAAVSVAVYPLLPPRVPVHFGATGRPDGYGSRLLAAVLLPLAMLALRAFLGALPRIDPKGRNYERFQDTFWLIVNGLLLFLAVMHVAMLGFALGAPVRVDRVAAAGLGVLLIVIGNYLARIEPNWFVGIRTPWTLSSEHVWRRTHRLGGWILAVGGVLCMLTLFVPTAAALPILVGTIALVAVVPVVISYVLWRREGSSGAGRSGQGRAEDV